MSIYFCFSLLSVTYDKGIACISDTVSKERLACIAIRDEASVVKVVCAFTTGTSGGSVGLQGERLGDAEVVITVGAGKVETDHLTFCFANFGYVGQSNYEATQSQIKTGIAIDGS